MDGQRFDQFARLIGANTSRRSILKLLGASIAGGLASLNGQRTRAAKQATCETTGDCDPGLLCCNGYCLARECCSDDDCPGGLCCDGSCRAVECCVELADPNPNCPPGYTCDNGACYTPNCNNDLECENGICCSGSCLSQECCAGNGQSDPRCPSGYVCADGACHEPNCQTNGCIIGYCCGSQCVTYECCVYDADPDARCQKGFYCDQTTCVRKPGCTSDEECDGICCGGKCVTSECCPDDPDTSNHCIPGYYCSGGTCVEPKCSSDEQCPGGQICCEEYCYPLECCSADPNPDARCEPGYVCLKDQCISTSCSKDTDCLKGICCGGTCTAGVADYECCLEDTNPNARCPKGTVCFEGICDPIDPKESCCAALNAGLQCEPNACCTKSGAVYDTCPSGSYCAATGTGYEGVCTKNQPNPQPTAQTTPATEAPPVLDKWALWTGDVKLAGATLYLRRLTAEDDPDVMGDAALGPHYQQADLDRLAKLGANYVEISTPAPYAETAPYKLDEPVRDYYEQLVRDARKSDLFSVISYRTGPGRSEAVPSGYSICQAGGCFSGGPADGDTLPVKSRLWDDEAAQDAWVNLWASTAKRYRGDPNVIGYHILAMPDAPDLNSYRAFLRRVVEAIRGKDPETPLLISAPGKGLPDDLDGFAPVDDDYALYRVTAFAPDRYLRQSGDADDPLTYGEAFDPAEDDADGDFDRDWLEASIKPAKTWAKDHERRIAIGGYGMPRWQPGLEDYLNDLLDVIEDATWRATLWLWHPEKGPTTDDAFNLEHGPDPDSHRVRNNALTDVVKTHWKDVKVRPSNF